MAREISEIYNEMIDEKNNYTVLSELQPSIDSSQDLLNNLTSTSKVAIWRLIFFIASLAIWVHEKLFDTHKAQVDELLDTQRVGTLPWYVAQSKSFQYGDSLTYNDNTYQFEYSLLDEEKKIISHAAAIETDGKIILKVVKAGSTSLEPLSAVQKAAFDEYIKQIKFAGTIVHVISENADDMNLSLNIVYDPLVLLSDGESIDSPGNYPVQLAVESYVQSLPFNGVFTVNELISYLKSIPGVVDAICKEAEARFGAVDYVDILSTDKESYQSYSGYISINNLGLTFMLD